MPEEGKSVRDKMNVKEEHYMVCCMIRVWDIKLYYTRSLTRVLNNQSVDELKLVVMLEDFLKSIGPEIG
ncbi:hypothetical protein BFU36_13385 [Sulfolobus sp. A20]|nr:hypothetical protein BFU36_13385 [Sulfolobus sp. A20]TRM74220.1 hypothetical protein DJ532_13365 [Sulfolobus sp. A20-N-F8]TRM74961.1 hypothetical protein DJ523_03815 [Sulfolobus sp. E5]TRM82137.1 hypothetical protein DJ531_09935 [Sulfolobus sp. A20-N-F6]TRM82225.1 hypothetical protein DJ524_01375 [Sulfolobus sp. D5]TRM83536.1 hypothetical protein DJ522_06120 [Sulfolobus sp. F3]TRM94415.1 hypothetical protein DJ526_02730 [Sulfolobus sp. A20-N-G8]TRM97471.1 hypothetical protein DMP16_02485 